MVDIIRFCATGKTGLGHLRRTTNVARALRERRPELPLCLVTNAPAAGLTDDEVALYRHVEVIPRPEMSPYLQATGRGPVIVDTAVLPGLAAIDAPLCLILRETVASKLERFRLEQDRPWDLIVLPNPPGEWQLDLRAVPARRVAAVGWIYRRASHATALPRVAGRHEANSSPARILIASGGGGNGDTWNHFRTVVAQLIDGLRRSCRMGIEVVQAIGPRADLNARIDGVDSELRPGPDLHETFTQADIVISTAGYNSVLELATTDVPVLLLAIPRTYDDQEKRARQWGPRLGMQHVAARPDRSVRWMTELVHRPRRRPIVDLGHCGATAAAALLEGIIR